MTQTTGAQIPLAKCTNTSIIRRAAPGASCCTQIYATRKVDNSKSLGNITIASCQCRKSSSGNIVFYRGITTQKQTMWHENINPEETAKAMLNHTGNTKYCYLGYLKTFYTLQRKI